MWIGVSLGSASSNDDDKSIDILKAGDSVGLCWPKPKEVREVMQAHVLSEPVNVTSAKCNRDMSCIRF